MGPSPSVSASRAKVAGLTLGVRTGKRSADCAELVDAYRDLAAAKIDDYIKRNLAAAPPLTNEQRAKLAELLRPVRATPVFRCATVDPEVGEEEDSPQVDRPLRD